jgi:hypothetical protein
VAERGEGTLVAVASARVAIGHERHGPRRVAAAADLTEETEDPRLDAALALVLFPAAWAVHASSA